MRELEAATLSARRLFINDELEKAVWEVQNGNKEVESRLIRKYIPFIKKTVSSVCRRFIQEGRDEELSIALLAFSEALHHYTPGRGASFLSFAGLVIRRRVIDFIRREQRLPGWVSLDYEEDGSEGMENAVESVISLSSYHRDQLSSEQREELTQLKEELLPFQITLSDVASQCPRHRDARDNMAAIAGELASDEMLSLLMKKKKRMPMNEVMKRVSMSRKTLERNRKYIIALWLILAGDYDRLKEWAV
ncbi:RNA polymerase sigma-I factor [Alkalicoccus urumqiensis]|uniref:RNA polymerase sigma-I factor n=1 Tax=Alkalicoccus urumqiensis TaxID=1548213 RepID=UPI0015E5B719|nr:RNA polymerase sigma-I factor [Alkalicoccus urumqiensis]